MPSRALAIAAIVAVLGTACATRALSASDLNEKIAAKMRSQQPGLSELALACPPDVRAEQGASFTCTFTAEGGFSGSVQVTQTDDAGSLSIKYPAPPGTTAGPRASSPGTVPEGCVPDGSTAPPGPPADDQAKVILFTRTAGFQHDSIPKAADALSKELQNRGFTVITTDDPQVFTADALEGLSAIVFLDTTGDVVNDEQQLAIEQYVRGGGGWAGIHSAADTEYEWPFYETLLGARFDRHPEVQEGVVVVEDEQHPSTAALPDRWTRSDEWYDFRSNPRRCVRVLATVDESTYRDGRMGADHPIIWCRTIGKGRSWFTALGHPTEAWDDPAFVNSVAEGIVSVTPTVPNLC